MPKRAKSTEPAMSFPALVQRFFSQYLVEQRALSPCTVAAYRDSFKLFLTFAHKQLAKSPANLSMADIKPELILAFLEHLERDRHNTVRSRNARLAALRAFLKFAARHDVASMQLIEHALAVPIKRFEMPMLGFLSREEMLAVLADSGATWTRRRDHLLITLLYNTGARVSEIIAIKLGDVVLDGAACVHLHGKGRKQRTVPLWKSTAQDIRAWLRLNPQMTVDSTLLPNRDGAAMTRSNVRQRLCLAVQTAAKTTTSLVKRVVTPHTIRHTTAMHLLQSGVDISVIALWLGHEGPSTTHMYVEADLAMKDRALARLQAPPSKLRRYHAPDSLLQFLKTL
jgi:site-specific recombinase XerD